jgi:hypothetical protein
MRLRVAAHWTGIASEPVTVEVIGGCLYGFASELACLRLAYKYRRVNAERYKAEYSVNRNSWFFRLEVEVA